MRKILIVIIYSIHISILYCQDPQYSQYYSAPLLLNPAFAGSSECYRAGANTRIQWPGLNRSFNTYSVFFDANLKSLRSGLGIVAVHDNIGTARLSTNEISAMYSYYVSVHKHANLRFGIQGTYASRNADYSSLIFEDQFNGELLLNGSTADQIVNYSNTQYLDFSGGVVLFGDELYWIGFSAHHLNRPDQSFYMGESRLPIKYSLHGGYNFVFEKGMGFKRGEFMRLIPTFHYKAQGKFDQLDVGVYMIEHRYLFGILYRGLVIKQHENIRNNDAVTLHFGYQFSHLEVHYSYDITTSRLGYENTFGSHEISIISTFCGNIPPHKHHPKHRQMKLACPDFQRKAKRVENHNHHHHAPTPHHAPEH